MEHLSILEIYFLGKRMSIGIRADMLFNILSLNSLSDSLSAGWTSFKISFQFSFKNLFMLPPGMDQFGNNYNNLNLMSSVFKRKCRFEN